MGSLKRSQELVRNYRIDSPPAKHLYIIKAISKVGKGPPRLAARGSAPRTMSEQTIARYIRERKQNTRCIADQIQIAHAMWDSSVTQSHEGIKGNDVETELELDLEYNVRTSLSHLEELGLVEEFVPPGPKTLVIAEWMDNGEGKIINGEVDVAANEGLNALAREIEPGESGGEAATATDGSGTTIRSVLAAEFNLIPDTVEEYLRTTQKPVDVLNRAVDAIEEANDINTSDSYGRIAFINMPYRYRLTEEAAEMYEQ